LAWTIEFTEAARKSLKAIDRTKSVRIVQFLVERVARLDNPRQFGAALQGQRYKGIWKYRVGDYRILAEIKDATVTILVVEIGHRREVYR
jgi:mRNA interferase RelE/StbE